VCHLSAAFEDLTEGATYTMAAEVGVLTRNVKIIGEDYDEMSSEFFGARVLIGKTVGPDNKVYSGK
jgi:hypothetical protein